MKHNNNLSLRDYNDTFTSGPASGTGRRGLRWVILGTFSGLALGLFSLNSLDANAIKGEELELDLPALAAPEEIIEDTAETANGALAAPAEPAVTVSTQGGTWHEVVVRSGDSMARIFAKQNIPPRQLHDILASGGVAKKLTQLYPGQTLRLRTSDGEGLLELLYEIDALNQVQVLRGDEGFESQLIVRVPERRTTQAAGVIKDSLFLAGQRSGLPDGTIMELASIFGWDIDFALDIREDDRFALVFEELYLDGERIGTGNILAAEFVNNNKVHQAVRYTDDQGRTDYYDPNGRSMRKSFLRTPVEFSRISSRFSTGRKHPVLNTIRAHKGVDYAAPRGTPVKATGNGKIVLRGTKGGYGKTVIIQHGNTYSTLYAHLSSYANGLRAGSRVQQGQIIGYVGSTGLATGPHLHYEFHVNGEHRNPLTVKLPDAAPLPSKYREQFKLASENLLSQLELAKAGAVALQSE